MCLARNIAIGQTRHVSYLEQLKLKWYANIMVTPGLSATFNYELMFVESGLGEQQHREITLDGLIWDLGVFNYGFDYV